MPVQINSSTQDNYSLTEHLKHFIDYHKNAKSKEAGEQLDNYLVKHNIKPDDFKSVAPYPGAVAYGEHYNHDRYVNLLKLCKVAYQYEKNGIPEEHAFKLTIMFNTEKDAYNYLSHYAKQNLHLNTQDIKHIEARALKEAQQKSVGNTDEQTKLQKSIFMKKKAEALQALKKQQLTLHNACLFGLPESTCQINTWKKLAKADGGMEDPKFRQTLSVAADIEEMWKKNQPNNPLSKKEAKASLLSVQKTIAEIKKVNKEYKAKNRHQDTHTLNEEQKEALRQKVASLAKQLFDLRINLFEVSTGTPFKNINIAQLMATVEKRKTITQGKVRDYLMQQGLSTKHIEEFLKLKRKDDDKLIPPIIIDGQSLGYNGLYLMKVPVLDEMHAARAAMLGRLTGCCQSLGDAGADCAKHGIESENGGFYVVCKGDINNPKVDDELLGQTWVWRSQSNAIVLDSIETNNQNNTAVEAFMNQLAIDLVKGGHTDKVACGATSGISDKFGITPLMGTKEYPKDYNKYRDSHNQRLIYSKKTPFYFCKTLKIAIHETVTFIETVLNSDEPLNENLDFCSMLNLIKVERRYGILKLLLEKMVAKKNRHDEYKCLSEEIDEVMTGEIELNEIKEDEGYYRFALSIINNEGQTLLQKAIEQGNKDDIDFLLNHKDKDFYINHQDENGKTAFMMAVEKNDYDSINKLLAENANPNMIDEDGDTALMLAIKNKDEKMALHLMNNSLAIDVDMDDNEGNHPIMIAAQYNLISTLKVLLAKGANYNQINENYDTALMIAARSQNPESFKVLLEHIPINQRLEAVKVADYEDNTVLHKLANSPESLRMILNLYPDDNQRLEAVKVTNNYGLTALYYAVKNPESLQMILNLYPDDNQRLEAVKVTGNYGHTMLYYAASNPKSLQMILNLYPDDNQRLEAVKATDNNGRTVLYYAANNPESLQMILNLYLDDNQRFEAVKVTDNYGSTVLHHAAYYSESVKVILESLSNDEQRLEAVKVTSKHGNTVLHHAAYHSESVKVILEHIPVNQRLEAVKVTTKHGNTVLHDAANSPESLRMILNLYPDNNQRLEAVKVTNNCGHTALHNAAHNHKSLQMILESLPEDNWSELPKLSRLTQTQIKNIENEISKLAKNRSYNDRNSFFTTQDKTNDDNGLVSDNSPKA